jgi:hypothetical protein
VLAALLDLLWDLIVPRQRRGAGMRQAWMANLERLTVPIARDLPDALGSGDQNSQGTVAAQAREAAAVLHGMKRTIVMPNGAAWQEMIEQLTGLAAARYAPAPRSRLALAAKPPAPPPRWKDQPPGPMPTPAPRPPTTQRQPCGPPCKLRPLRESPSPNWWPSPG